MTSTPQVQTVRGPVSVSDLGAVLMHEHVFVLSEEIRQSLPETWDEQERVSDANGALLPAADRPGPRA